MHTGVIFLSRLSEMVSNNGKELFQDFNRFVESVFVL